MAKMPPWMRRARDEQNYRDAALTPEQIARQELQTALDAEPCGCCPHRRNAHEVLDGECRESGCTCKGFALRKRPEKEMNNPYELEARTLKATAIADFLQSGNIRSHVVAGFTDSQWLLAYNGARQKYRYSDETRAMVIRMLRDREKATKVVSIDANRAPQEEAWEMKGVH